MACREDRGLQVTPEHPLHPAVTPGDTVATADFPCSCGTFCSEGVICYPQFCTRDLTADTETIHLVSRG